MKMKDDQRTAELPSDATIEAGPASFERQDRTVLAVRRPEFGYRHTVASNVNRRVREGWEACPDNIGDKRGVINDVVMRIPKTLLEKRRRQLEEDNRLAEAAVAQQERIGPTAFDAHYHLEQQRRR